MEKWNKLMHRKIANARYICGWMDLIVWSNLWVSIYLHTFKESVNKV